MEGGADLGGVRVGRDYLLSGGAGTHMERTTIGHDFVAAQPSTVQTGKIAPDSPGGAVTVGHDVLISGSPAGLPFVFDGEYRLRPWNADRDGQRRRARPDLLVELTAGLRARAEHGGPSRHLRLTGSPSGRATRLQGNLVAGLARPSS